jgi:hypothetical protein
MRLLNAFVLVACSLGATTFSSAADLPETQPPTQSVATVRQATQSYVERDAVLLMIRTTFNVVAEADVESLLEQDLKRIGGAGPSQADLVRLDRDLVAEGSYYLVSLKYTIEAGGAVWPTERPERNYENDALAVLDSLQDQLIDDVETGADPLPVFVKAQQILALTNGEKDVPASADRFGRRDALVKQALAAAAPWADT